MTDKRVGSSVRRNTTKQKDVDKFKARILEAVSNGVSIDAAAKGQGKSKETVRYHCTKDPVFKRKLDEARGIIHKPKDIDVPDFPEFSEKYLGIKLYYHQLQWFDVLEGRKPRDMHASMTYERNEDNLVIINTPPGHAKSSTITMAWVTWNIVKNPDVRILIASKTQNLAAQFLNVIKAYLSSDRYAKLHEDFGPPEGYDKNTRGWSATQFYVNDRLRASNPDSVEEKDPTCQATGIGGQVYGMRVDIIVMDDCVDLSNAHQYDNQINWLQSEVMSRVPPEGKVILVGTRLAPRDLYSELQSTDRYNGEQSPFTYFAQPAVLEFTDDKNWLTLWPKTNVAGIGKHATKDENGEYTKWDYESLRKIRARNSASTWARVYQQQQIADDTIFKPEHVKACINPNRMPGLMHNGAVGHRKGGMSGLHVVAGLDPAAVGYTAAVCIGLDTNTGVRYVLDVFNKAACKPEEIKGIVHEWQDKYSVKEWRIESNAFQKFLTNDFELKQYIASRGGILVGHNTNRFNKHDEGFGVMSMAQLFELKLIELPRTNTEAVRALVEQLFTWQPKAPRGVKTDTVMALWFANVRCGELVTASNVLPNWRHGDDQFLTGFDKHTRKTYKPEELEFKVNPTYYQWSR